MPLYRTIVMGCMRPACARYLLRISCVSALRLAGSGMGGCKGSITGPSARFHVVGYPIWIRTGHWRGSFLIRHDYRIFRHVILVGYRGLGMIRAEGGQRTEAEVGGRKPDRAPGDRG